MSETTRLALRFGFMLFIGAWCFLMGVGLSYDVRRALRRWRERRQQARQRDTDSLRLSRPPAPVIRLRNVNDRSLLRRGHL